MKEASCSVPEVSSSPQVVEKDCTTWTMHSRPSARHSSLRGGELGALLSWLLPTKSRLRREECTKPQRSAAEMREREGGREGGREDPPRDFLGLRGKGGRRAGGRGQELLDKAPYHIGNATKDGHRPRVL